MENQKKSNNILLIILVILVVGLGGFIVYDKVLKDSKTTNNDNNSTIKNRSRVIYKIQTFPSGGQVGDQILYEYVPSDEKNTQKELLRNEDSTKTLEIISNEGTIYFLKRSAGFYQKEKAIIYNVDLKSIEVGLKIGDSYTNLQSYYISSGQYSYYRLYATDSEDVYEYDYNFNKIASLSDKIGIKDFKVLGIVDSYAFITDEKNIYAINLINYSVIKSKGMIPYTLSDMAEPLYIFKNVSQTSRYRDTYYFYTKENGTVESEKYYFDGSKFDF